MQTYFQIFENWFALTTIEKFRKFSLRAFFIPTHGMVFSEDKTLMTFPLSKILPEFPGKKLDKQGLKKLTFVKFRFVLKHFLFSTA